MSYPVVMDFIQSLKTAALQIIDLSNQSGARIRTWDQEKSAPAEGFTDRAGFLYYDDDFELYADVYGSDDEERSLLRARLARIDKDKSGEELFTMITLDFATNPEKTKELISNSENLTQQMLIELLNDPDTTPEYIQTSLGSSGKSTAGTPQGKRYEYNAEKLQKITEQDQIEFLATLDEAYEKITKAVHRH